MSSYCTNNLLHYNITLRWNTRVYADCLYRCSLERKLRLKMWWTFLGDRWTCLPVPRGSSPYSDRRMGRPEDKKKHQKTKPWLWLWAITLIHHRWRCCIQSVCAGATDFSSGTEKFVGNSLDTYLVLFVKLVSGCEEACNVFSHLYILLKEKNTNNQP